MWVNSGAWDNRLRTGSTSRVLPFTGNDEGRNRRRQLINTWFQNWCYWQNG